MNTVYASVLCKQNNASWTPIELCFLLVTMTRIQLDQHLPTAVKLRGLCLIIQGLKGKKQNTSLLCMTFEGSM